MQFRVYGGFMDLSENETITKKAQILQAIYTYIVANPEQCLDFTMAWSKELIEVCASLLMDIDTDEDIKALIFRYAIDFYLNGFTVGYYLRTMEERATSLYQTSLVQEEQPN